VKRKAFKAVKKYVTICLREKELEREEEIRRKQIEGFFQGMRERAREEEERLKREKLEKIQKD